MGIVQKQIETKSFKTKNLVASIYLIKRYQKEEVICLKVGSKEIVLDQEMVKELLPHLQRFAETGEL